MKRTEMKRTPMKQRSKPRSAGDFTLVTKQLIYERDGGRCFRCGVGLAWGTGNAHHRQPRGQGGSKYDYRRSLPSNGILLCAAYLGCHEWIETHRQEALLNGWLVPRTMDPSKVPCLSWSGWKELRIDGTSTFDVREQLPQRFP